MNLKVVSKALNIYKNRNFHKLKIYQTRRKEYMMGVKPHMSGFRYGSEYYGFPDKVFKYMREWFEDDECSTPDKWGRKVLHIDGEGSKTRKVIRHVKAGDRDENHQLFVKLSGRECMELYRQALRDSNRKMSPRIPGTTVLESCRPSFVKYFRRSEFGECSTCKPAYDNYRTFMQAVYEQNPHTRPVPRSSGQKPK